MTPDGKVAADVPEHALAGYDEHGASEATIRHVAAAV
jgi:hypothetical protein